VRIGVISDTHAKTDEDLNCLAEIARRCFKDVDIILHAGDMVSLRVLEILQNVARTVAVKGNMDFPEVKETLPNKTVVKLGSCKIGLMHGWGSPIGLPQRVRKEFEDVDCIVFGHSHQPFNREVEGVLLFNPGSAMDKFFAEQNSIGYLDIICPTNKHRCKIEGNIVKV